MNFLKKMAFKPAYKSQLSTIRDHSEKLIAHHRANKPLSEQCGAFGTALQYQTKLEKEYTNIIMLIQSFGAGSEYFEEVRSIASPALELKWNLPN